MTTKLTLISLSFPVLLGCGGVSPDDLLARYRAEGSVVPLDESGNTLRFTSREKYSEFSKKIIELGFPLQREVTSRTRDQETDKNVHGITYSGNLSDGCRGELTMETYTGAPPMWKFFSARTVLDAVYPRHDGYDASVIAKVALPKNSKYVGQWVDVKILYNGSGYNSLSQDYGEVIVSMDGSYRDSGHQCGWGSSDLDCCFPFIVCLNHCRRRHEDLSPELWINVKP